MPAPSLSQVRVWDVAHLTDAAAHWTKTATVWEEAFGHVSSHIARPGGTPWEGVAAQGAQHRAYADRLVVTGLADQLFEAAAVARRGADQIEYAQRRVLDAVNLAGQWGFTVGEDFSITGNATGTPVQLAARQSQAQAFATDIRTRVGELVAVDQHVAAKIASAVPGVGDATFDDSASRQDGTVQAVDNHTEEQDDGDAASNDPAPSPAVRGLPPEGVVPPVPGPLTEGPAGRPSERRVGGRSLWDEHGGEWRYFPGDEWHNPHWDYNPHSTPSGRGSEWDNIPINGLPPRIGDPPPIISALPPWLQAAPSVGGPLQNPLLTPFPGISMPTAPNTEYTGPHFSMPHVDMPTLNAGDLQNAGGPTAVAGGAALLLLVLGAMALA